jgi:curved DNA-binding protein CbpA
MGRSSTLSTKQKESPKRKICNNGLGTTDYTPHYYNLRIPPTASDNQIRKAHRNLALLVHPDHNRYQKENAQEVMMILNTAADTLYRDKPAWAKSSYDRHSYKKNFSWDDKRLSIQPPQRAWFRDYDQVRGGDPNVHPLREEAWVEFSHWLVNKVTTRSARDRIWNKIDSFRKRKVDPDSVVLNFYDCNSDPVAIIVKANSKFLPATKFEAEGFDMVLVENVGILWVWGVMLISCLLFLFVITRWCFGRRRRNRRI